MQKKGESVNEKKDKSIPIFHRGGGRKHGGAGRNWLSTSI